MAGSSGLTLGSLKGWLRYSEDGAGPTGMRGVVQLSLLRVRRFSLLNVVAVARCQGVRRGIPCVLARRIRVCRSELWMGIRVPEGLGLSQVGSAVQEMGGEAVAEIVRVEVGVESGIEGVSFHDHLDASLRQPAT